MSKPSPEQLEVELQALTAAALTPIPGKTRVDTGAGWYTDALGRQVYVNAAGQRVRVSTPSPAPQSGPDPYLFETGGLTQTQRNARARADADSAAYQAEVAHTAKALDQTNRSTHDTSPGLRAAVRSFLMRDGMPNPSDE